MLYIFSFWHHVYGFKRHFCYGRLIDESTHQFQLSLLWKSLLLQPLCWHCAECAVHHERNVREEQRPYMWREQAIIEWSYQVNSVVACCHNEKLRIHATWAFGSQENGAVTRMWRSCCMKPSQKECVVGAVHCKKEGMLLQPLLALHWMRVCEEQHSYTRREQAIIEWSRQVNSIVACCHSIKLCAHAARAFRLQHYLPLKK